MLTCNGSDDNFLFLQKSSFSSKSSCKNYLLAKLSTGFFSEPSSSVLCDFSWICGQMMIAFLYSLSVSSSHTSTFTILPNNGFEKKGCIIPTSTSVRHFSSQLFEHMKVVASEASPIIQQKNFAIHWHCMQSTNRPWPKIKTNAFMSFDTIINSKQKAEFFNKCLLIIHWIL